MNADPRAGNKARMKFGGALVVFLLSSAARADARAQDEARRVEVVAEACLDAAAIDALLRDALAPAELPPGFSARVVETAGGASVEMRRGQLTIGTREIDPGASGCTDLNQAVAITIAVAADAYRSLLPVAEVAPVITWPGEAPVVQPAIPDAPAQRPRPDASLSPLAPAARDASLRIGSSVEVGAGIGLTPGVNPSTSIMVELAYGPLPPRGVAPEFSVRAGMFGAFPTQIELVGQSVTVGVLSGRLDLCGAVSAKAWRVRGCGTGLLGASLVEDPAEGGTWLRAGTRLDALWMAMPQLGLTGSIDVLANFAPSYVQVASADGGVADLAEHGPASLLFSGGALLPWR